MSLDVSSLTNDELKDLIDQRNKEVRYRQDMIFDQAILNFQRAYDRVKKVGLTVEAGNTKILSFQQFKFTHPLN